MKYIVSILLIGTLLLQGCRSARETAAEDSRYKRRPIVETTEEQLAKEAMMINATTKMLIGDRDSAGVLFSKLIEKDPTFAAAYYEKSAILHSQRRLDSAIVYAQKAVELAPEQLWYKLALAALYDEKHDGKNLVETWKSIVAQEPEKLDYRYELSNAYLLDNNFTSAINELNKVEKMVGVTEPVSLQKIKLWEAVGKYDMARKELEALAQAMPKDTKYSAMLAETFMKEKKYDKAKQYYDQILEADPESEYIHVSLAEYYKAVGEYDKAAQELAVAFGKPGIPTRSKMQILSTFYTEEEFYGSQSKNAFMLMEKAMEDCEDSVEYAPFYGDVLMHQGRYREAARQFELSLSRDSSRYEVWEALLVCLHAPGDPQEDLLLEYSQRASALFPLHQLPYYMSGYVYYTRSDYDEALKYMQKCEKLGFRKGYLEAETYGLTAELYRMKRDYESCFRYYDKYLAIVPNDVVTLNNYAYYLADMGQDLEKAEKMSRRTLMAEPDNPTYLDTYGWVLHKLGRDEEALRYLQKAVRLDKENSATLVEHLNAVKK